MFMVLWNPPLLQRPRANAIVLSAWRGIHGMAWRQAALVTAGTIDPSAAPRETSLAGFVRGGLACGQPSRKKKKQSVVRVSCSTRRVHRAQNTVREGSPSR